MLSKKLFFSFLITLSGIFSYAHAMIREPKIIKAKAHDQSVIPNAAYFKIHGPSRCLKYVKNYCWGKSRGQHGDFYYLSPEFPSCKTADCTDISMLSHEKDTTVVTYHDKNWGIIALMDVTNLGLISFNLRDYLKNRLDPDTRPIASKVIICKRCIYFYDAEDQIIFYSSYSKKACPQGNSLKEFEEFVDVNGIEKWKDFRNTKDCILF